MKCLEYEALMRIETQEEWEQLLSLYQNHCNACARLLESYRPQIEAKIAEIARFCRELWEDEHEITLGYKERQQMLLDRIPWIFGQILSWPSVDDAWRVCRQVVLDSQKREFPWNTAAQMQEQIAQSICKVMAFDEHKRRSNKEHKLPENWKDELESLLEGEDSDSQGTLLTFQPDSTPIYYETETFALAADSDDIDRRMQLIYTELKRLQEPLWKNPPNKYVQLAVILVEDNFFCEIFTKEGYRVAVQYERNEGVKIHTQGESYVYIRLGSRWDLQTKSQLQIFVDDNKVAHYELPSFLSND